MYSHRTRFSQTCSCVQEELIHWNKIWFFKHDKYQLKRNLNTIKNRISVHERIGKSLVMGAAHVFASVFAFFTNILPNDVNNNRHKSWILLKLMNNLNFNAEHRKIWNWVSSVNRVGVARPPTFITYMYALIRWLIQFTKKVTYFWSNIRNINRQKMSSKMWCGMWGNCQYNWLPV